MREEGTCGFFYVV